MRFDLGQRRPHPIESAAHATGELVGCALGTEADSQSDDGGEHVVERRRREVDDLDLERAGGDDLVELVGRDRADLAQLLGDDDLRVDLRPHLGVHGVERLAVAGRSGDGPVDLRTAELGSLNEGCGDGGPLRSLRRPVAFMRDAHDLVSEAEREERLRRGRDERADSHSAYASYRSSG
jgi:hypothetical protein